MTGTNMLAGLFSSEGIDMTKPHNALANAIIAELRQRLDGIEDNIMTDIEEIVLDNIIAFEDGRIQTHEWRKPLQRKDLRRGGASARRKPLWRKDLRLEAFV